MNKDNNSDDAIELQRFEDKGTERDSFDPCVSISTEKLRFNKAARKSSELDDYPYANFYISEDGDKLGIKPVRDGDVDVNSYKLRDGEITCKRVIDTLDIDVNYVGTEKVNVQWNCDEEMWVAMIGEE